MSALWTVLWHELRDAFRDRRMVTVVLTTGVLLPVILNLGLERLMMYERDARRDKVLEVVVVHPERAPNLVAWLESNDVRVFPAPEALDEALRSRRHDVALEVFPGFQEDWRESRPARVDVVYDNSQMGVAESVERLRRLLTIYSQQVGAMRLTLHGVAPDLSRALLIGARDVSTPDAREAMMLAMLPFFLLFGATVGAGQLAVDLTAGERERQSLEPLLATPASRSALMLGKIGAASTFGLFTVAAEVALLSAAGAVLQSDMYKLGPAQALPLVLILAPMAVAAAAALTIISAFSKTVREAQASVAVVMLAPLGPLTYMISAQPKATFSTYAIPFVSQFQLCIDVLRGEELLVSHLAVHAISMAGLLGVLFVFGSRLYLRERLAISS